MERVVEQVDEEEEGETEYTDLAERWSTSAILNYTTLSELSLRLTGAIGRCSLAELQRLTDPRALQAPAAARRSFIWRRRQVNWCRCRQIMVSPPIFPGLPAFHLLIGLIGNW